MKAKVFFSKEKLGVPENKPRLNAPFISPEVLKGIIVGIILLIVLAQVGFFKTYSRFFPESAGVTAYLNLALFLVER